MIKFKTFKLYPSEFSLDIWIGEVSEITPYYLDFYGFINPSCEDRKIENNECAIIYAGHGSKAKGEKRIVIKLESLSNLGIVVHEAIHALFDYSKLIGTKLEHDTTEWNALMGEYIFNEIMKDNYEEIGDIPDDAGNDELCDDESPNREDDSSSSRES